VETLPLEARSTRVSLQGVKRVRSGN